MGAYVLKLKGCFDILELLGTLFTQELAIDFILNYLTSVYKQFTMNYYMNGLDKSIMELHGILKTLEESIVPPSNTSPTTPFLSIMEGGVNRKRSSHPNYK